LLNGRQLGWSSQDLTRKFGVDPSTVSRWENEADPLSRGADRLIRSVGLEVPTTDQSAPRVD
jgi:transcriptional regulator with XRE-family HTH domain